MYIIRRRGTASRLVIQIARLQWRNSCSGEHIPLSSIHWIFNFEGIPYIHLLFFFSCSFVSFENLQSAGIRSIHRNEYILQSSNKTCGTFMERQGRGNVLFIFFEQYYSIQPRAVVQSCATENIMSLCICKCCHSYFLLLCWVCLWNRGAFFIPFFLVGSFSCGLWLR